MTQSASYIWSQTASSLPQSNSASEPSSASSEEARNLNSLNLHDSMRKSKTRPTICVVIVWVSFIVAICNSSDQHDDSDDNDEEENDDGFIWTTDEGKQDPRALTPEIVGTKLPGHLKPFGAHKKSDGTIDQHDGWVSPAQFWSEYVTKWKPVIFRGARDWPVPDFPLTLP